MATPTNQFRLKLAPSTSYNFTINWGDGNSEIFNQTTSSTEISAGLTHTYASPSAYRVSITENVSEGFPRIYFNGQTNSHSSNDDVKVTDIIQWGNPVWSSMTDAFEGCSNLSAVATDGGTSKLSGVSIFDSMFSYCSRIKDFPVIDTSNATSMVGTWQYCTSLSSFPFLNTSKVTNFASAFINCPIKSFPLLDTSKTTNFSSMLYGTKIVDAPFLNTLSGTNFNSFLANCTELTGVPLFDLSNATDVSSFFNSSNKLKSIPLFNTSKATNFRYFANSCSSLTSFPMIDTSKGTNFDYSWFNCNKLKDFPLINTISATNFTSTWQNCISLSASEFPTLNMSKMTIGTNCFNGVKLTTTSYSSLLTSLCATNFNNTVTFHGGNSNYNSTVPQVTAARNFLVTPILSGGRGWTITDGGPDIDIIISTANQYWYTDFEAGTATKTSGYALSTDVQVIDDNGSVVDTQYYQGTKSYYCNSRTDSNAGLTFVVNPTAFNNTNGFIIDFMVYKVAGDNYPTMLGVGLSSRDVLVNQQVFGKNYNSLRWLGTNYGSVIAQTTGGVSNIVANNTSWGAVNNWHRITYYYNNVTKYGSVYVDGVGKQTALQERGWNTLPDGNILIGLFNYGTNGESSDNGIEAYLDNLGFYTL